MQSGSAQGQYDGLLERALRFKGLTFDGKRYPIFDIRYVPKKSCKLHTTLCMPQDQPASEKDEIEKEEKPEEEAADDKSIEVQLDE